MWANDEGHARADLTGDTSGTARRPTPRCCMTGPAWAPAAGSEPAEPDRDADVVLYGATGFVGRLTARHVSEAATGVRVALAGRDRDQLEALKRNLDVDWPVLLADTSDAAGLEALARSTRALASAVGRHGMPLARACAQAGTSYADLSGEVPFVRRSIDGLHDIAASTGARIVHGCGFDAVPSDLSTYLLAEAVRADGQGAMTETIHIVEQLKGGFSGGNLDSNQAQSAALRADPALRAAVAHPWALTDPQETGQETSPADADPTGVFRDALTGRWLAPSLSGPFNSRLVRRSASLDGGYGPDFHYREAMGAGTSATSRAQATGLAIGVRLVRFALTSPGTARLMKRLLPPGSGPSQRVQDQGSFRTSTHTRTSTGARYVVELGFGGDPGYAATSVMLGQAVLSLGSDALVSPGGVLTPASAMGHFLVDRLVEQGFDIAVHRLD